ncbi:hypothetical protein X737_35885 [Mesorhizobium sp. L48C026A00]|nr:hypothetical protein X737_35885 [Mesorhizobium sp. L48C026A00]
MRVGRATKTRIDFNDDWTAFRAPEFNVRWPPAKAESSQTAQRNIGDALTLLFSQQGRIGHLTNNEMREGTKVIGANRNDLVSHNIGTIERALCEFFDEYFRRRPPYVLSAQQISRMFGYVFDAAAQSDTDAAAAYCWLKNHGQADLRSRAFYLRRIRCQPISRYWDAGLREELALIEFIAASFNRFRVRSR